MASIQSLSRSVMEYLVRLSRSVTATDRPILSISYRAAHAIKRLVTAWALFQSGRHTIRGGIQAPTQRPPTSSRT